MILNRAENRNKEKKYTESDIHFNCNKTHKLRVCNLADKTVAHVFSILYYTGA